MKRFANLPAWLGFLWAVWAVVDGNLHYMDPPTCLNRWDEGYLTAFAGRLLDGQMLPYVDAISQRGPVLYWMAAAAVSIWGRFTWMPVRVLSLLCILATVLFGFFAARRAGRPYAGAVMAVTVFFLCFVWMPGEGVAFNGEHAVNLYLGAMFLSITIALTQKEPALSLLFGAGVLGSLSVFSKQLSIVMLVPPLLWVVAAMAGRLNLPARKRIGWMVAYVAGFALPTGLIVGRYAWAGQLETFWYWIWVFNDSVYMAPVDWSLRIAETKTFVENRVFETLLVLQLVAAGIWWGVVSPLRRVRPLGALARAYDDNGFFATTVLAVVMSLFAAAMPMRYFVHYFVLVVPWIALLIGIFADQALKAAGGSDSALFGRRVLVLSLATTAIWFTWKATLDEQIAFPKFPQWQDGEALLVCKEIDEYAGRDESIFVWGFEPDLYVQCGHKAGSRYVFTIMQTGYVPWIWQEPEIEESRVVPGAREDLCEDLERERPAVIVDAPKSLNNKSIEKVPLVNVCLRTHYCFWKKIYPYRLWVRREFEDCDWTLARQCLPVSAPDEPVGDTNGSEDEPIVDVSIHCS